MNLPDASLPHEVISAVHCTRSKRHIDVKLIRSHNMNGVGLTVLLLEQGEVGFETVGVLNSPVAVVVAAWPAFDRSEVYPMMHHNRSATIPWEDELSPPSSHHPLFRISELNENEAAWSTDRPQSVVECRRR
jgi:hypothetical protein